mgnify:CR=1 FL=1
MRKQILLIAAIILTSAACVTQKKTVPPSVTIVPLSDTVTITDKALIYALPMTVFEIDVVLERSVEKPGPYAAYAADLIGLADVIRAESEEWSVRSLTISPLEEIDPAEYYVIKSDALIRANSMALRNWGLLLDIGAGSLINREVSYAEGDNGFSNLRFNDLGATQYFSVQSDTAYRVVSVDTTFLRIPYLVERRRQLTNDQLAERAARTLLEIREGRHLILTGEATVFPQHDAPVNEINRLEKEYLSLFVGKTWSETVNLKIYFTPDADNIQGSSVLFRLSDSRGVTDATDASGTPVTIALVPTGKTKPLYTSGDIQLLTSAPAAGLTYRIPEVAEVTVRHGNNTIYRSRTVVHQLGQKVLLPENFLITK